MNPLARTCLFIMWASLASAVAGLLLFVCYFHRPLFNSDEAVVNMLAQSMVEQGRLLPIGWITYNGDQMMPSGALIVAPLLHWFPNGFMVHAVAGAFAVVALLGALAAFLRVTRIPIAPTLMCITICAAGFSHYATIYTFAQTTYMWWPAGFFACAALIYGYRSRDIRFPGKRLLFLALICLLVFCITFANPARVLIMMVLPLYAYAWRLGREHPFPAQDSPGRRWIPAAGLHDPSVLSLCLGFASAALAYYTLRFTGVTETAYGAASLHWGGWASVWRHAATFARGWFSYVGGTAEFNPPGLLFALLTAFRYFAIVTITYFGLRGLLRIALEPEVARAALVVALAVAFFPVLAIYVLFEPLAFQNQEPTVRYFTVPIFILVALCSFDFRDALARWPKIAQVALAFTSVMFVAVAACRYIPIARIGHHDFWNTGSSNVQRLGELLEGNNLKWGYATWWNAGGTMIMSDSRVTVYPVQISNVGVRSNSFMALRDWYSAERFTGSTFLALEAEQATDQQLEIIAGQLGAPVRTISSNEYTVLVYDHNIAGSFDCHDTTELNAAIQPSDGMPRLTYVENKKFGDGTKNLVRVTMRNETNMTISGSGSRPVSVGAHLLDANGAVVNGDWVHAPLRCPMKAGSEMTISLALPTLPPGKWRVQFDVVQEGVVWFQNRGGQVLSLNIEVQRTVSTTPHLDQAAAGGTRAK